MDYFLLFKTVIFLEKTRDKQINTFHLFVDFKSAFDTSHRNHLYTTMPEFGIPAKLIRLCEMTLKNAQCVVKVGNNLSETFDAKRGFRPGDSLSWYYFNILMAKCLWHMLMMLTSLAEVLRS